MAESFRLFAVFGRSTPENWGTTQAICMVLWNWPTASGSLHFLRIPPAKIAERLRLFAFFDTHMMKLADRLRLCAFHARKLRNASGCLHAHDENRRPSQAVCTFWPFHSRKLGNVSGYLQVFMNLADSFRLFALFAHSTRENCGTSQAICIF